MWGKAESESKRKGKQESTLQSGALVEAQKLGREAGQG